jgi:hypothetical protein
VGAQASSVPFLTDTCHVARQCNCHGHKFLFTSISNDCDTVGRCHQRIDPRIPGGSNKWYKCGPRQPRSPVACRRRVGRRTAQCACEIYLAYGHAVACGGARSSASRLQTDFETVGTLRSSSSVACSPCVPGRYGSAKGLPSVGTAPVLSGEAKCIACKAGKYLATARRASIVCVARVRRRRYLEVVCTHLYVIATRSRRAARDARVCPPCDVERRA